MTEVKNTELRDRFKATVPPKPSQHRILVGGDREAFITAGKKYARELHESGKTATSKLFTCDYGHFMQPYSGHAALSMKNYFQRAQKGVLMVEEPYLLIENCQCGHEALMALMTLMEKHTLDSAVIFSGDAEKMQKFLEACPGFTAEVALPVIDLENGGAHKNRSCFRLGLDRKGGLK